MAPGSLPQGSIFHKSTEHGGMQKPRCSTSAHCPTTCRPTLALLPPQLSSGSPSLEKRGGGLCWGCLHAAVLRGIYVAGDQMVAAVCKASASACSLQPLKKRTDWVWSHTQQSAGSTRCWGTESSSLKCQTSVPGPGALSQPNILTAGHDLKGMVEL